MSQLRLNPLTGRWVTVAGERATRPRSFLPRTLPVQADPDRPCPFCPGNEEETPPALETYGRDGHWRVRVVPNLYPAFYGDAPMVVSTLGPIWTQAPASGIHEVVVFSPDHSTSWADLDDKQAGLLMAAIRDRIEEHARTPGLRYSQVIVNHGREAGASLEHPHGQLIAVPFVPGEMADEEAGFRRFEGSCLLCTTLEAERGAGHRVVLDATDALVLAPYWSGVPYELLIVPEEHEAHLHRAHPADVVGVGHALRAGLRLLREHLGDVAYNVVFHAAPYHHEEAFHWHVHVLPNLTTRAGFELGTGVLINVVAPEEAAESLRRLAGHSGVQAAAGGDGPPSG